MGKGRLKNALALYTSKNGGCMLKGRIVNNISNLYYVETNEGIYECNARGKFKNTDIIPVVGDIVNIEILDEENKKAIINTIEERKNYIKRPKLSNITQLVFVLSSKMPKPDLLLLDKQLSFAEFLGIKSVIIINKIDLDEKVIDEIEKIYSNIGYKVVKTVAKDAQGIEQVKQCLKGEISAFSGNSGVGKSTLINSIFGNNTTQEGIISSKNKKGKNTTTTIKLYKIDEDTYIADTPGFSTFDISEIETKELENYFIEFKNKIKKCEFVGCTHIKEQNCEIKKEVENGNISEARYNRYIKIYEELKDREEHKW